MWPNLNERNSSQQSSDFLITNDFSNQFETLSTWETLGRHFLKLNVWRTNYRTTTLCFWRRSSPTIHRVENIDRWVLLLVHRNTKIFREKFLFSFELLRIDEQRNRISMPKDNQTLDSVWKSFVQTIFDQIQKKNFTQIFDDKYLAKSNRSTDNAQRKSLFTLLEPRQRLVLYLSA